MGDEFTLFETAIGPCAIVWNEKGIRGVQLPERNEVTTRARVMRRFPGARPVSPPPVVERVRDGIVLQLRGDNRDLSTVQLDLDGVADFDRRVYDVARAIPAGATLTYGEVANRVGDHDRARDVGQSLARNPFPIVVPCHRVIAAGGKVGGFSANGGITMKLRLLAIEGALLTSVQ
jgi:methylated-DNA-[protein]-cysteine S-methyltransferase